jgi:long-chain acyl-CoA synthetase
MMTRAEALAQLTAAGQPHELVEVEMFGRRCRAFKNAPPTLRDLYAATRSDLDFLVYDNERYTYEDVWRRACRLARAFVEDYGVRRGDRVAISLRNYPEWVIAFNAATSIGAIAVAMNALWQPGELEYALNDCDPKVFVADQERLDRLAACENAPGGMAVIAVRATAPLQPGWRAFADVMSGDAKDVMPEVGVGPDDDAIMLYTSGSTGHPKGAVSCHRNIISALLSWEVDGLAAVLTGRVAPPAPGGPRAATLLGIPLFHVSGLHAVLLSSYRAQRRVVSMYRWDAEKAAELIEAERITSFTAPSAVTGDLVRVAAHTKRDLSSLVVAGGGGAARAPEQVRAIDKAFGAARPGTGWGMTETNAIGAGIGGQDYLDHPESSGRAAVVLDLRIVNEAGETLPAMERGELQVRGTSVMRGYWRRPDANEATFDGEWLRTGDVAYLDLEGFVYIVDRIKDLVIRGGENIGCGAVEAALLEHPDVLEASVYGVPDERLGEELGATLHVRASMDETELRAFLAPRLARYEIPRYFHFAASALPRIASGKILKRQLRDEAVARLAAATVEA